MGSDGRGRRFTAFNCLGPPTPVPLMLPVPLPLTLPRSCTNVDTGMADVCFGSFFSGFSGLGLWS
jgi:hypothetical protein